MADSFTARAEGIANVLRTPALICAAFDPNTTDKAAPPERKPFMAIWDTGATGCVITQAVIDACGLKPISMMKVHGVHGEEMSEVFLVNIELPNDSGFAHTRVTKGKLTAGSDVLIGMDIINQGDFAVTNYGGKTVFTFRCPSKECIDFGKLKPIVLAPKRGRNDPCVCGSGKKFKHCCGKFV